MTHMTTLEELNQHIALLASVEETRAPFISCYLDLENGQSSWRDTFDKRTRILRHILKGSDRNDLEDALANIEEWLATELLPEAKGAAIFVRVTSGGAFMLPMQFAAPLPNWIAIYPTPNIYHLVELKDTYERYLVMIATADFVRILEVNLGAATIQAWSEHPPIRERVGWEWGETHYQLYRHDRGGRFLREKIRVLAQLTRSNEHSHLILAGDPEITRRIRHALPDDLAEKLVDVIPASKHDQQVDVVKATLSSFIEYEEQDSQSVAERLIEGLRSQNLAVAGSADTLDMLRWGNVDTLVMNSDYQPDPGWTCSACRAIGTETPTASTCPECGQATVRPLDVREALLRLAGQLQRPVEVVDQSDALMSLGGVGCLLRYRPDFSGEESNDLI